MHVLIFELNCGGHRLQYVKSLIEALVGLADEIVFVTSVKVLSSEEYKIHIQPLLSQMTLDASVVIRGKGSISITIQSVQALLGALKRHQSRHIYLPLADGFIQFFGVARLLRIISLKKDVELEALLMRGGILQQQKNIIERIRNWMQMKAIQFSQASIVHFLSPLNYDLARYYHTLPGNRLRLMPEAVENMDRIETRIARSTLGIPEDGRYISCLGRLDKRKGIACLLKSFATANLADNDRLFLMGKLESDVKYILDTDYSNLVKAGRVIVIDRYVSQEELEMGLFASDVICTPYPKHIASSGIVVRAAAAGVPILASNIGWMGEIVPRFELGQVCNVNDTETFAVAIKNILKKSSGFEMSSLARKFNQYNTMQNFSAHWTARLRERMEIEPAPDVISWESVCTTE